MTLTPMAVMAWWCIGLRGMTGRFTAPAQDGIASIALTCPRPRLI